MKKITKPYEILIRYDQDGNLLGAHMQSVTVALNDDGSVFGQPVMGDAVPLALEGSETKDGDFKLVDVLGQTALDALATVTRLDDRVADANRQIEALNAEKEVMEAQLRAANSRLSQYASFINQMANL